jgi:hypothetical protein
VDTLGTPASADEHPRVHLDMDTVDVVGYAMLDFAGRDKVVTADDALRQTRELLVEMANLDNDHAKLEHFRKFCIAFGNSLLDLRASYWEDEPSIDFRR